MRYIDMLMRICNHCGKSHPAGEHCTCRAKAVSERNHKYDTEQRDMERHAFYQSPAWDSVRLAVKARANGLDQYALAEYRMIGVGNTAHHIIPLAEAPELALDMSNLIWVSAQMHSRIHKIYECGPISKKDLQDRLRSIISPGGDS